MIGINPLLEISDILDEKYSALDWRFASLRAMPQHLAGDVDVSISGAAIDDSVATLLTGQIALIASADFIPAAKTINIRLQNVAISQGIALLAEQFDAPIKVPINLPETAPFQMRYAYSRAFLYAQSPVEAPFERDLAVAILLADHSISEADYLAALLLRWHEAILASRAAKAQRKDVIFIQKDSIQSGETCAILARAMAYVLGKAMRINQ